jgi:hypothetical protein
MGGQCSERIATKTPTDEYRSIDLAAVMRVGCESGGLSWSFCGRVVSSIRSALKEDALEIFDVSGGLHGAHGGRLQVIPLVSTSAGFGGSNHFGLHYDGELLECAYVACGRGGL